MAISKDALYKDPNGVSIQESLSNIIGVPYVGNIFFVDPTNGNDTTGTGRYPTNALKTITAAYAKLTDNNHDVIVIVPGGVGSGTGTIETAAITWSKNLCHLVGSANKCSEGNRARITTATAALSPFFTISGSGNSFHNIQIASGADDDLITVRVSGSRNYFENVHFAQQNATAMDNAASYDLEIYGGSENEFHHCTIGNDSTVSTAAQACLKFTINGSTQSSRNKFYNCMFSKFADAAAPFFVSVTASAINRYALFQDCIFHNAQPIGATTMTDAFTVNANPGGILIVKDCVKIGATGWGDNAGHIYLLGDSSNSTYNQGIGFAVNPAA